MKNMLAIVHKMLVSSSVVVCVSAFHVTRLTSVTKEYTSLDLKHDGMGSSR